MARESSRGRLTVATRLLRELEDRGDNRLETGQMALQNAFLLRRSNMGIHHRTRITTQHRVDLRLAPQPDKQRRHAGEQRGKAKAKPDVAA